MKKRITIKDVAREAGVSVATVSYVMNNRTDIQISEKTRKKVLQISNLLGYTPNQAAQALATSQKRMLAIYMPESTSVLVKADQMYVLDFLSSFLQSKNYGLVYLSADYTERYDRADAIVCYDASSDHFHQIGDRNFVPLLALDCLIADNWLFFQVNTDYKRLSADAAAQLGSDYTLLLLDTPNQEKKALLDGLFPSVAYVSAPAALTEYADRPVLIVQQALRECLAPLMKADARMYYAPLMTTQKAEALFACMERAMERTPAESHDIQI
ncbi:MAG: LacI family transcriptional regulator [Muribaculaceae bacterium]|nr:LacI family transcriptional regulator [Roseburia sp.]MCM1432142.1 LacI family transcriptional regulator [Muribaculaceae bacterium]MCM1493639.1 LacI family transcriptional regulator [Muribaculaceae bacterium]MCM1560192.1 LacI family transcriptional regulator [Butyrivibrio sp.]